MVRDSAGSVRWAVMKWPRAFLSSLSRLLSVMDALGAGGDKNSLRRPPESRRRAAGEGRGSEGNAAGLVSPPPWVVYWPVAAGAALPVT